MRFFNSFFLRETSVALDALFLLQHTAADDAKGEEEHGHSNSCWRVVVFYGASTICAVIAGQSSVLLCVLVEAFVAPLSDTFNRLGGRFTHPADFLCSLVEVNQ